MFNAKLPDCGPFAQAITAAGEVLDEGYFKVFKDRLEIRGVDTSCDVGVEVVFFHNSFEMFHCEKNLSIRINCKSLAKIMKGLKDRKLHISVEMEDPTTIKFFSECVGGGSILYSLFTTGLSDFEADIPNPNNCGSFCLSTKHFAENVRNLNGLGDTTVISMTQKEVKFTCGENEVNGNVKVKATDIIYPGHNVTISVATRYLNALIKTCGFANQVKFFIAPRIMMIQYNISSSEAANGYIKFYFTEKLVN